MYRTLFQADRLKKAADATANGGVLKKRKKSKTKMLSFFAQK